MIEISTTATFDRLFKKPPSTVQRKAITKTDLFKSNPFHPSLHTEKSAPRSMKFGASESTKLTGLSLNLSAPIMPNSVTSVTTIPSTTLTFSNNPSHTYS